MHIKLLSSVHLPSLPSPKAAAMPLRFACPNSAMLSKTKRREARVAKEVRVVKEA